MKTETEKAYSKVILLKMLKEEIDQVVDLTTKRRLETVLMQLLEHN
jgi:hypothetical protein